MFESIERSVYDVDVTLAIAEKLLATVYSYKDRKPGEIQSG